jgi:hypothetical protein
VVLDRAIARVVDSVVVVSVDKGVGEGVLNLVMFGALAWGAFSDGLVSKRDVLFGFLR